jgi:hypothetical protein
MVMIALGNQWAGETDPIEIIKEFLEYDDDRMSQARKLSRRVRILLAYYDYEDYSGSAFVLFKKDGKLYEVNGSHCSCYGLEECGWDPEETSKEILLYRLDHGNLGTEYSYGDERANIFAAELREVLAAL